MYETLEFLKTTEKHEAKKKKSYTCLKVASASNH